MPDVQKIKAELFDLWYHNCNGRLTIHPNGEPDPGDRPCTACSRIMELQSQLREEDATSAAPSKDSANRSTPGTRIEKALDIIGSYGSIDGDHHKAWVLDQVLRSLTGDVYDLWLERFCRGEDGPDTYEWDTGVAP